MARKLTTSDVLEVTHYSRGDLRAITAELQAVLPAAQARIAREYSRLDLIVLAAMSDLERRFGMRREAATKFFMVARKALSVPRELNPQARLLLTLDPLVATYFETDPKVQEGIVLPLQPVFDRVDRYLVGHPEQPRLTFGPTSVATTRTRRVVGDAK